MSKTKRGIENARLFRKLRHRHAQIRNIDALQQLTEAGFFPPSRVLKEVNRHRVDRPTDRDDRYVSGRDEVKLSLPKVLEFWYPGLEKPFPVDRSRAAAVVKELQQQGLTKLEISWERGHAVISLAEKVISVEKIKPNYGSRQLGAILDPYDSASTWRQRQEKRRTEFLETVAQKPSAIRIDELFVDKKGRLTGAQVDHTTVSREELIDLGYGQVHKDGTVSWRFWFHDLKPHDICAWRRKLSRVAECVTSVLCD